MTTKFTSTLFFLCGMAVMAGCTSEQDGPDVRRMAEQGSVTFEPSMALTAHWDMPEADDWGTTRGFASATDEDDGVAVIRFAGSRPMGPEVTRGSRYEGNSVEGQSYQTLKTSDKFRVSGYRYDPTKGETVSDVAEPNFFDNAEVSYIGKWQATSSYYIPTADERTDFFAWFVPSGTEGVTLSSDQAGGLKLDYAVPSTVAKQPDLLTAVARSDAYNDDPAHTVPLSFRHQLTEVNFVVGEELSPGIITEIAFTNICTEGTLDVSDGKWTPTASPTTTAFPLNFQTFNNSGRRKGATILGGLMMIPQQFTNANQRIQLTITIGTTPYMVYAGLSPDAAGAPQGWRAGEVVTYVVSSSSLPQLKPNTLTVSPTSVTVKQSRKKTATVTTNTSGGTLSVESSDPTIATATISGSTITINGIAVGTTTVKVTSAEKGEYAAAMAPITVEVVENTDNAPEGVEAVDLGLPSGLLWANMNIGATTVTGAGSFFAWGETAAKSNYTWATYKWGQTPTKYNATDGKTQLDLEDDAAAAIWEGSWRMPTSTEFQELLSNTTVSQVTVNGVACYKYACKTDASRYILLPKNGGYYGTSYNYNGYTFYWTSTRNPSNVQKAWFMRTGVMSNQGDLNDFRFNGYAVRAVQEP